MTTEADHITCAQVRAFVLDGLHRPQPPELALPLRRHLESCDACCVYTDAERALSDALQRKLPRFDAPKALRRRLEERVRGSKPARRSWRRALTPALAAAAAFALSFVVMLRIEYGMAQKGLVREAVNDHLRVLEGAPLAEVRGGIHEVKPWFGGKLDFAPDVRFAGDPDFPLQGGIVERFLDRRAAVFEYKRRLHSISLLVVRAEGLDFPSGQLELRVDRGFHVVLWKTGDQGFLLASDLNSTELLDFAKRVRQSEAQ